MTFSGHLHLEASRAADGRTVLSRQSFCAPFHLSKPYWDGVALHVQVVNPTAGMLEGDELETDVTVGAGASLLVTTPSHARAFRVKGDGGVLNRQRLRVAAGGWLDWFPEPLVPHAGCDYCQETAVNLEPGAALFFCESLGPGRAARGELWAWRRLELGLSLRVASTLRLRERFALGGDEAAGLAKMAGQPSAWIANCAIVGPGVDGADWDAVRALHAPPLWVGASRLEGGDAWTVRVIAPDGQALRSTLSEIRRLLARTLAGLSVDLRRV